MTTLVEHTLDSCSASTTKPRLLLVAYSFPPVGGAGVQRPVKWVKYLSRFGWDVTVLTTSNPSVPARDESLLADIPAEALVLRAKTWEPDYRVKQGLVATDQTGPQSVSAKLKRAAKGVVRNAVKLALQPDPQILWVPNAIRAGDRILREVPHDAILVTAPAYSSFFIGTYLKRRYGLPLILDFRDEWDMSGRYLENAQRDIFSRFVQHRMQNYVLKQADAVIATTQASTTNLAGKLERLKKTATPAVTIYNGFDADEFDHRTEHQQNQCGLGDQQAAIIPSTSPPGCRQDTFRLLYTGTLWNLTTVEPLVQALLKLNATQPELLAKLEFVCVGRKTAEQNTLIERIRQTRCRLQLVDYCPHAQILEYLRQTDAVCLLLSDVPGAERVVPGKLFEYLANRKEMLAIVPQGETADIVQRFFPQGHLEPQDIDGIAAWLTSRLTDTKKSEDMTPANADINEFSRTTQTQRLAQLLDDLVQAGHSHRSRRP
jgi:glycosyltransferase involved in cell wall biosynthesis